MGGIIVVKDEVIFLWWLVYYGMEWIIFGVDVKEGFIVVSGW